MVVTSSHEIARNLVDKMALRVASWTCMNMNLTSVQPSLSNQCMDGLFGTFKLLKSSHKDSYFNIRQPWNKTWKIEFPLQVIYLSQNWPEIPLCIQLIFFKCAQFFAVYSRPFFNPRFLALQFDGLNVYLKCPTNPWFFFVFNQETHSTFHHIYKTIFNHYTFCPFQFGTSRYCHKIFFAFPPQ